MDDLESDFSVFHRVDDMESLPGPRFFKMAYRIATYGGAVAAKMQYERSEQERLAELPEGAEPVDEVTRARLAKLGAGFRAAQGGDEALAKSGLPV